MQGVYLHTNNPIRHPPSMFFQLIQVQKNKTQITRVMQAIVVWFNMHKNLLQFYLTSFINVVSGEARLNTTKTTTKPTGVEKQRQKQRGKEGGEKERAIKTKQKKSALIYGCILYECTHISFDLTKRSWWV
jgi:hypothetical protein